MSICIDNLIKHYIHYVLGANVFEKIQLRTLILISWKVKGVCRNKTTLNNLKSHSHHELKGIEEEKEREY